jgi:hypothetical protein
VAKRSEAAKAATIRTFARRAILLRDAERYETFFKVAHAALVLRGYDKASEIHDKLLRELWTVGRALAKRDKSKRRGSGNG